jgi:polyferredoxin
MMMTYLNMERKLAMEKQQINKEAKLCIQWAIGLTVILIFVFPGIMFITGYQYSLQFFKGWTLLAYVWLMVAGFFITVRPLIELFKKDQ